MARNWNVLCLIGHMLPRTIVKLRRLAVEHLVAAQDRHVNGSSTISGKRGGLARPKVE
jgi:hypothetical protein